jgi:tetratricopeptide (TPR) repeat protein
MTERCADRAAFESFRTAYADAQAAAGTDEPSLHMLLRLVEPSFADVIRGLSVPHWFDEEIVAKVCEPGSMLEPAEVIGELADLPFVRLHPHGYAYHDIIRTALRDSVLRVDAPRLRRLCCAIVSVLDGRKQENTSEDIVWESMCLMLGCDEAAGFERLNALFHAARTARRFTVCATLATLANEQRPVLSAQGRAWIDFYRGINAFDRHLWEEAARLFDEVAIDELPTYGANDARLYRGRVLEASEQWGEAERIYRDHLALVDRVDEAAGVKARLHQCLARVSLRKGDLRGAEAEAKRSLEINQSIQDRFGEALNLEVLGQVYSRLGDVNRARDTFDGSLAALNELGREFDKSRIYVGLAQVYAGAGQSPEAESYYRRAQEVRAAAGDNYGLAFIYASLGTLYAQRRDMQSALRYFDASLAGFQLVKDRHNSARILRNISLTYEQFDDLTQAIQHMQQAVDEMPDDNPQKVVYLREVDRLKDKAGHDKASLKKRFLMLLGVAAISAVFLVLYYIVVFRQFGW